MVYLLFKKICIPELKQYKTDNAAGDGKLLKSHFLELEKDVIKPIFIDKSLEYAFYK